MTLQSRDIRLIDALEGQDGLSVVQKVWRVVREGRDPTECAAAGGRWDDGTFDVLYTSVEREGCLAELEFHLRKGQPLVPSKLKMKLFELQVRMSNVLDLSRPEQLSGLGMDMANFGRLSFGEHRGEYPQTQQIAEVAHFHGHDGLLVPSARYPCANLIVFCDRIDPDCVEVAEDHGPIKI